MKSPKQNPSAPAAIIQESQASSWGLVSRLVGLAWRHRWLSAKVVFLQVILLAMALGGLGLTGLAIDYLRVQMDPAAPQPRWWFGIAPPGHWPPLAGVSLIAAGIGALALLRMSINYGLTVSQTELIQRRIVADMRKQVYDKLQRLSFRFFDDNESGSIINRVAGDVQRTSRFLTGVLFGVINVIISIVVYITYMVSIHVTLTLTIVLTIPLLAGLAYTFSRLVRRDMKAYLAANDKMVLTLSEHLQGVHVVKGFARQREAIDKFRIVNRAVHDKQQRIFWRTSVFSPLIVFVTQINTMIVLGYGGYLVVLRESDPNHQAGIALGAGLFVFAGLVSQFSTQVQTMANITNQAQECLTSAARVFEILDTPLEIQSQANAVCLPRARGHVKFEAVTFGYKRDDPVLVDLDFEAQPGQCVAILGTTGAGKSTLLSLVPRFYDPLFGRVLVDGVDVRRLNLDDLRRNIGLVFQESFLFSNTIAWNIAFGAPDATRSQIESAAKIACAHEFIMQLPKGYDTVIGERGSDLSGGQRQRLAIARALLLEPPILLLDDPTAAIDPETEHEILQAIDNAMTDRTTFIVAHRLSTLRRADRVVVLENGRIVQSGTHEELMNIKGHYRKAATLQVADEESKRLLGVEIPTA